MTHQVLLEKNDEPIKQRHVGLDIYRILCCFCITTVHLFGYSDFLEATELTAMNRFLAGVISAINIIGTNGFVFITGYYLSDKGAKVNISRILSFVLGINFLSIVIYLISLAFARDFHFSVMLKSAFPLMTQHFWYPFNYIVLLCLSPYLNMYIEKASRKKLFTLVVFLLCVVSIFLKINVFYKSDVFLGHRSHSIIWWIVLYLSAAYCRKYTGGRYRRFREPILFAICACVRYLVIALRGRYPFIDSFELLDDNSILGWLATYASFTLFRRLNITCGKRMNRVIKYIVQATFVIYMFQEHDAIRSYLWTLVDASSYAALPVYELIAMIIITFGALGIISIGLVMLYSLARRIYLDRLCRMIVNTIEKRLVRLNKWYDRLLESANDE